MEQVTPQYAAGLFDGEGCITGNYRRPEYGLSVVIGMKHKPTLEAVQATYGGHLQPYRTHTMKSRNFAPSWQWYLHGAAAARFLRDIQPYSITKREHIVLGLHFLDTIQTNGEPLSETVKEIRRLVKQGLKILNKKGKQDATHDTRSGCYVE